MWQESWPNLMMKMRDMPYYKYNSRKAEDKKKNWEDDAKPGDLEVLQSKFKKYIQ
jgi:hypothetical protein